MTKKTNIFLDFIVDKLTNSIENILTGDSFPTEISVSGSKDLKSVTRKNGWFLIGARKLNLQIEMYINSQSLIILILFKD
ncbi:MAG: hypothetical protein WKG06_33250 [Segetibacter sp.]